MSRIWPLLILTGLLAACAPREYLTPSGLADIQQRDPELHMVRVYPNVTFISVYARPLGEQYDIERSQGAVIDTFQGRRIEAPISRKLRGAILELERREGKLVIWVSFDSKCVDRACAYGFVETEDSLYRLFQVPAIDKYAEPFVYRKRISRRKRMKKTKVYSRSRAMPVYFTTRGITASVALEIKRQERIEIETITVENKGVPGEIIVDPEANP
ncbi:MAG: hypothetical protein KDK70_07355 [Myxococcales bacterium]|nr:hypothetical protein [Myxococcales bacterium]